MVWLVESRAFMCAKARGGGQSVWVHGDIWYMCSGILYKRL